MKGLLSDDGGKTFQEWCDYLGGKSVNGVPVLFPHDEAVPYHLYWKVLNAKHHGVPQNRERVFLIGIRDDNDNHFRFPKEEHLDKKLKDVLEDEVDEKYFLSDKAIDHLISHKEKHDEKGTGFGVELKDENSIAVTLRANEHWIADYRNDEGLRIRKDGNSPCLAAIRNSEKDISKMSPLIGQKCIPVLTPERTEKRQNGRRFKEDGEEMFTITTQDRHGVFDGYSIRRLTPRECFRLMDFTDSFDFSVVSDSQAYKQAGNSIVVRVLEKIIDKLKL